MIDVWITEFDRTSLVGTMKAIRAARVVLDKAADGIAPRDLPFLVGWASELETATKARVILEDAGCAVSFDDLLNQEAESDEVTITESDWKQAMIYVAALNGDYIAAHGVVGLLNKITGNLNGVTAAITEAFPSLSTVEKIKEELYGEGQAGPDEA